MEYIDISPVISENIAVFPGDSPFRRKVALEYAKGDHLVLSEIRSTVHLGAHADAPSHYHPDGESIDRRDLSPYMGTCQVVSVKVPRGARITAKDLGATGIQASRVLIKTGSFPDPEKWNSDFNSLSPELIEELASKGVALVGVDTPSVDPETSKGLESHQAIFRSKMAILEGLVLEEVADGFYTLIALPLRIKDADASPVRAILLPAAKLSEGRPA
jgi:arylformamidase